MAVTKKTGERKVLVSQLTADQAKVLASLLGVTTITGEAISLRVTKAKSTPKPCACGCGQMTKGGTWVSGHDGILVGLATDGDEEAAAIIAKHPALAAKVAEYRTKRQADREARRASLRASRS